VISLLLRADVIDEAFVMKNMTVRGIDPLLAEKLKETAGQQSKSINQLVVEALREHFGVKPHKGFCVVHEDMDDLFGKWTVEEFNQIQGEVDAQRSIDPELWK
jgi:hypothetical protein